MIQTKEIQTASGVCAVYVGDGAFSAHINGVRKDRQTFVLTDKNVFRLYSSLFQQYFSDATVMVLPSVNTEKNKSEKILFQVLKKMSACGLRRDGLLIAIGGGTVGDLGGLAASLYMRGIGYVQIPTTLLAQVDSALGGKTAINLGAVKNVIGTFYSPEAVIADPLFLPTLPAREVRCGLGEIVKYAQLSPLVFQGISALQKEDLSKIDQLSALVAPCLFYKADVVEKDEKDHGERKSLNLGHTTAHALELAYGFSHGESVLLGLWSETRLAVRRGWCKEEDVSKIFAWVETALFAEGGRSFITRFSNEKKLKKALSSAWMDKKNERGGDVCVCLPLGLKQWALYTLSLDEYVREMMEILKGLQNRV